MSAPEAGSPADFSVHLMRTISAPTPRVFEAWVRPEIMRKWWLNPAGQGPTACKIEPRVGGRYEIRETGCTDEHGRFDPNYEWIMQGEFLEIIPMERLVFTWNVNHRPPLLNNRVTVQFSTLPYGTQLTITHTGLPTVELRNGTYDGWTTLMNNLARALERMHP